MTTRRGYYRKLKKKCDHAGRLQYGGRGCHHRDNQGDPNHHGRKLCKEELCPRMP